MLKISTTILNGAGVSLQLEGRLSGPWVPELAGTCESFLSAGKRVTLHLAEVEFLDASGIGLLRELQRRGVQLTACSPFVAAQLNS